MQENREAPGREQKIEQVIIHDYAVFDHKPTLDESKSLPLGCVVFVYDGTKL